MVALGGDRNVAMDIIRRKADTLPRMAPEDKEALLDAALDTVAVADADRLLAQNPSAFKRAVKDGRFNGMPNLGKYVIQADKAIEAEAKKAAQEAKDLALLQGATQGTSFLDPANTNHRKLLDKYYQQFTLGEQTINDGLNALDESSAAIAVEFADKYKMIPESMQGTLRGMMNAGNAEQKAFAYDVVNEMRDAQGFTDKEKADASTYEGLIDTGYDAQSAINTIAIYNGPDFEKTRSINELRFKEVDFDARTKIRDRYGKGVFNLAPEASEEAIEDFTQIYKNEFLKTGDATASEKIAHKIMDAKYGQSEMMGGEIVMPYPPEKYGHPNLTEEENRKWMRKALKKDLKDLGRSDDLEKYKLYSIFENRDLVNSGQPPAYYILDTESNDYVKTKENTPLVYFFDPNEGVGVVQKKQTEKLQKLNSDAARAKAVRDIQLDPTLSPIDKFFAARAAQLEAFKEGIGEVFD
jgi:hypothetical protein